MKIDLVILHGMCVCVCACVCVILGFEDNHKGKKVLGFGFS